MARAASVLMSSVPDGVFSPLKANLM